MPRTEVQYFVLSPETADSNQPTLATAHKIFLHGPANEANLVELPREVDGEVLVRGMIVNGFGQVFAKAGSEVKPEMLHLNHSYVRTTQKGSCAWD